MKDNPIVQQYHFDSNISFLFLPHRSQLLIRGPLGVRWLQLSHQYFYSLDSSPGAPVYSLLFHHKRGFVHFIRSFSNSYREVGNLFFARVKIRGLGYKIKRFGLSLLRFYFTMENYIHLHLPPEVLVRHRKRKLLLISNNFALVRTLLSQILLLQPQHAYSRKGIWSAGRIIFLRKRTKK